jgi:RNA-directed DNA polymerase
VQNAERRRLLQPQRKQTTLRLLDSIATAAWPAYGRCSLCGSPLLHADDPPQSPREWEQWLGTNRKAIIKTAGLKDGTSDDPKPRLIHAHCQTENDGKGPALLPAHEPTGLA